MIKLLRRWWRIYILRLPLGIVLALEIKEQGNYLPKAKTGGKHADHQSR